jgi:hypothetical protein
VFKKNSPGCPCCDCECFLDTTFTGATQDAGMWTYSVSDSIASTTDSDAFIRTAKSHSGWKIWTVQIAPGARDEYCEVGFTNADYTDRVYAKFKLTTSPSTLVIEWRETVDGLDALINTQTITVSASAVRVGFNLLYHPDLGVISGRLRSYTAGAVDVETGCRQSFTVTDPCDWFYIGTGTITGTATVTALNTRQCYGQTDFLLGRYKHTGESPAEWSIELSGVAQGVEQRICEKIFPPATYNGYYDFYDEFNDTHVVYAMNWEVVSGDEHRWEMRDEYTWSDPNVLTCYTTATKAIPIVWKVWAYFDNKADSLIDTGGLTNEPCGPDCECEIGPDYDGGPVLLLKVEAQYTVDTLIYKATWAAVVEADWLGCDYDYNGGCQQKPLLTPASCSFDWRTITQQKLTFICARKYTALGYLSTEDTGIDWTASDLYITAVP